MRRTKNLLWISLAVNIFIGGMLVSRFILPPPPPPGGGPKVFPGAEAGPGGILNELPPKERDMVKELMDARRPQIRQMFDDVAEAREDVADILKAKSFDETAFDAAVSELKARQIDMGSAILDDMTVLAHQFSPDARRTLARLVSQPPFRPRWPDPCQP